MIIQTVAPRLRRFIEAKPFETILVALFVLVILIAVFEAGVFFGMREARSSYRWGENYDRNFGGPGGGFMPSPGSLPNGHGAFGRIASTSLPTFIITDPVHPEEHITIGDDTVIRDGNTTVSSSALTVGTYVIIVGSPGEQGSIEAKLIRIMPAPPQMMPMPPQ